VKADESLKALVTQKVKFMIKGKGMTDTLPNSIHTSCSSKPTLGFFIIQQRAVSKWTSRCAASVERRSVSAMMNALEKGLAGPSGSALASTWQQLQ
jgi:hypothetical protein